MTFVAVFGLAAVWSFASPLASAPDEAGHLNYATTLVHGHLVPDDVTPDDPLAPPNMETFARHLSSMTVPSWANDTTHLPDCFAFIASRSADCSPPLGTSTADATNLNQFGRYPPAYYLAVGWPTLLLTGADAFHAVRLVSAALSAALVASAMASAILLPGRRRFAALGVGLALTPMAVFFFGTASATGFEIAAALAVWLTTLALLQGAGPPPTRLVTRAAVTSVCLVSARPASLAYLAMIVVVVAIAALRRERLDTLIRTRSVQIGVGAVALASLAAIVWILVRQPDQALLGTPEPNLALPEAAWRSFTLVPERTSQMIGLMGWLDTPQPTWLIVTWLTLIASVVLAALVLGRRRQRIALLTVVVFSVAFPVLAEARVVAVAGFIWQGRYTLPLAVGVPVIACWIVGDRARAHGKALGIAAVVGAALISAMQMVAHARALDRYVGGLPTDLFSYLSDPGWRPPLGRKGQFLTALTATTAWGAVLAVVTIGSTPTSSTTADSPGDSPPEALSPSGLPRTDPGP